MEGVTADCNPNKKSAVDESVSECQSNGDNPDCSPELSGRFPRQPEKRFKPEMNEQITENESPLDDSLMYLTESNSKNDDSMEPDSIDQEENVDSGICVEKSESTSSDDPMPSVSNVDLTPEPVSPLGNELVKRGLRRSRQYRLHYRNTEGSDNTDSDDDHTNMDSDTADQGTEIINLMEDARLVIDNGVFPHSGSDEVPSDDNYVADSDSSHNLGLDSDESNIDSDDWSDNDSASSHNEETNSDYETPMVLFKKKPPHKWNIVKELLGRERGTGLGAGRASKDDVLFEQRFYGSLHTVERLELMYKMEKHSGCVNCINFHPEGKLLVSGSDDLNVVLWDWTINKPLQTIKSGHKSNVFQSKFLHLNAASQLNIVTCARDGQVRLLQVPPSGGNVVRRRLAQHTRPAHKLYSSPAEPHVVISAGEDGSVILSDVRQESGNKLLRVKSHGSSVALYSVAGHPLDTNELCVAGRHRLVRLYDRRKAGPNAVPTRSYCPEYFLRNNDADSTKKMKFRFMALYVTCAVYNHDGTEILASYNDDDIYLFDRLTDNDAPPGNHGFTHRYAGHRNCATFKAVSFFGPHSEFVVSGSDCGNIYIWDKKSEAIVQWMIGDEGGIVNGIECHPRCPVLATSGLDSDIKIWVPSNESDPKLIGLREAVSQNTQAQLRSPLTFLPALYGVMRSSRQVRPPDDGHRVEDTDDEVFSEEPDREEFDGNACRPF